MDDAEIARNMALVQLVESGQESVSTEDEQELATYCLKLNHTFWHSGPNGRHMCLVFDLLGENLLALVKGTGYKGLPLPWVRKIALNVLLGCKHLQNSGVIHTDIKLENVLVGGRFVQRTLVWSEGAWRGKTRVSIRL